MNSVLSSHDTIVACYPHKMFGANRSGREWVGKSKTLLGEQPHFPFCVT